MNALLTARSNVAVVIARAQINHFGHGTLFAKALSVADRVIVVLGSAFHARDIRNPFTWQERKQMILLSLPEADQSRVEFIPVRDYYNDARWLADVKKSVGAITEHGSTIALVGHFKADTKYLHQFSGWKLVGVEPEFLVNATSLRQAYFSASNLDVAMMVIGNHVHPNVVEYLRSFACLQPYQHLCKEWKLVKDYKVKYPAPYHLTADAVVEINDHVLLIQRGSEVDVGYGLWAFPGGFLNPGEQFYDAAKRELGEETSYCPLASTLDAALRDSQVFDHELRSVRGRVISQAFQFRLGQMREFPEIKPRSDANNFKFVHKNELACMESVMFEDHIVIADRFYNIFDKAEA